PGCASCGRTARCAVCGGRSRRARGAARRWPSWASSRARRMSLRERVEALTATERQSYGDADRALFAEFRTALARGEVRAAERTSTGAWCVNTWVKRGILLGFRIGALVEMPAAAGSRFFDKDTYPLRPTTLADRVRIVPGGSSIRDGAYVAPGVVCMPPMYVNVGAYV